MRSAVTSKAKSSGLDGFGQFEISISVMKTNQLFKLISYASLQQLTFKISVGISPRGVTQTSRWQSYNDTDRSSSICIQQPFRMPIWQT